MQPGGEAAGDSDTLQLWFTRRGRACLRKWRWLVVLAIVSTILSVAISSAAWLVYHVYLIDPAFVESSIAPYYPYTRTWLRALVSLTPLAFTYCATVCGVALTTLVSLAQIPPAEVQLPFAKHELAYRLRARLRANSWRWIGGTFVIIQTAATLWAVDRVVVAYCVRGYIDWHHLSSYLVNVPLALLLLYGQAYAVLRLRRTKAPGALYALPYLCVVGLGYVIGSAGSVLISMHVSVDALLRAIPLVNGFIAAAFILACWVLDRLTLAECRRLVEEPR